MVSLGTPCDIDGQDIDIPSNTSSVPRSTANPNPPDAKSWHPFQSCAQFELADFLFCRDEMSGGRIDELMDILAALDERGTPPFVNHEELYDLIDDISPGEKWECISIKHADVESFADEDFSVPTWKKGTYDMWIQDPKTLVQKQLANPELKDFIDYAPHQVFGHDHQRVWSDFMTGNWAWEQCVSGWDMLTL